MPVTPKPWLDLPATATPADAAAFKALEVRAAASAVSMGSMFGPAVEDYASYRVVAPGGSMNLNVGVLSGRQAIVIPIGLFGETRRYEGYLAAPTVTVSGADGANPRIDCVIAEAPANADSQVPNVRIIAGVATVGATLANRTGAPTIPATSVLLADVLVGAGVTAIVQANVEDRRPLASLSTGWVWNPSYGYTGDAATLEPVGIDSSATITAGTVDTHQAAALMQLTKRITATKVRWRYVQGATAASSQWNMGIASATGRILATVGATAFSGAANAAIMPIGTLSSTVTFEPGLYWVWFAVAAMTASSSVTYAGAPGLPAGPGQFLRASSGGVTAPSNLDGLVDPYTLATQPNILPVPTVTLTST